MSHGPDCTKCKKKFGKGGALPVRVGEEKGEPVYRMVCSKCFFDHQKAVKDGTLEHRA